MKLYKRNKPIRGFGINDADYFVKQHAMINGKTTRIWTCPFYVRWVSMVDRCYANLTEGRSNYSDCTVHEDWKYFSNFKSWMETQDWEGKQLDKDILFKENKVYSPQTCIFVDQKVNKFLCESNATRGEFPIGVSYDKRTGKYLSRARALYPNKQKNLGLYPTPEEAHQAWLAFKLEQAKILASEQTDQRVAKALIERYENYTH